MLRAGSRATGALVCRLCIACVTPVETHLSEMSKGSRAALRSATAVCVSIAPVSRHAKRPPKRPRNVVSCCTPGCGRARCTRPYRSARCAGRVWRRHSWTHLSEMPGYSPRALRSAIAVGVSGVATCRASRARRTRLVHPPGQCSWVRFWRSSQSSATCDTSGCRAMHSRGVAMEPPVERATFKLRVPGCELPSRSFAVRPSRQAMTCDACPESWIGRRRRRRCECVERLP